MASTPFKSTTKMTPTATAPARIQAPFAWLQPTSRTNAAPLASARTTDPFAWLKGNPTAGKRTPTVADNQTRLNQMLEKLGVTDKTLGSRDVFNSNPTGKSTATFGDPNASTNPLFSRVVPHPAETIKAAAADPFAWLHPTPVAAGRVTVETPNDAALASRTGNPTTTPAINVVAQGSVYQDPSIAGGLAQSVDALNSSQSEQAALQQQWKERLFNIAFGYGSDIGTDAGLLGYSKSRDALALLGSSFGTGKAGGASFRVPSLDIAGMVKAKADFANAEAERNRKAAQAAELYWAQNKVNQNEFNPWSNESIFDKDKRKQENLRNVIAATSGFDISNIR